MAQGTFGSHVFEPASIFQNVSVVSLLCVVSVCRAVMFPFMQRGK